MKGINNIIHYLCDTSHSDRNIVNRNIVIKRKNE